LTQAGTYLPSGTPDTERRLKELFDELADHDGSDPAIAPITPKSAATSHSVNQSGKPWPNQSQLDPTNSIEIEGRRIPVIRERGGVVWFDFMALCSGPRSQEDYIEIARDYQSVIVSDIPVFDSLHEDEARRFIALVDELYDRNVNLIVSAAAPPLKLYRGDRVAFQFERTASRLIEMQSEEYLAREHRP
jgi:predicted ATPase